MRQCLIAALIFVVSACFLSCKSGGTVGENPSDKEIRDIINAELARPAKAPLGEMTVVTGTGDSSKNEVSEVVFRYFLLDWEKKGFITLSSKDVLSNNNFTWNDWFARTQRGQLRRIKVTPTEKGLELQKKTAAEQDQHAEGHEGWLYIKIRNSTVEEIVDNREIKKAVDRYRIVKGTWVSKPTEAGVPITPRQKFIRLYKYDSFKKTWVLVTGDYAIIDKDFGTHLVEQKVAELQLGG